MLSIILSVHSCETTITTQIDDEKDKSRDLFLARPSDPESHYSILGTIMELISLPMYYSLMTELNELLEHGFTWKLEGLYTPGQNFVEIANSLSKYNLIPEGNYT